MHSRANPHLRAHMDTVTRAELNSPCSVTRGNCHRSTHICTYRNLRSTADSHRHSNQHGDIIPHANYDAYRYSNQHAFDYPFANVYSHAHGNTVANAHSGTYLDAYQHTYAIADSRAYSHSYPGS